VGLRLNRVFPNLSNDDEAFPIQTKTVHHLYAFSHDTALDPILHAASEDPARHCYPGGLGCRRVHASTGSSMALIKKKKKRKETARQQRGDHG